jgi:hypothetical protein
MKPLTRICLTLIAASAIISMEGNAQTNNTTTNATTNSTIHTSTNFPPTPGRAVRPGFHGKITDIDSDEMTLTLTERTGSFKVKITSLTKITKGNQPGRFDDAVDGQEVTGQGIKGADGAWEAAILHISPLHRRKESPDSATDSGR